MNSRRIKSLVAALCALVAAVAVSACGNTSSQTTTGTYAGESGKNAPYLHVGPLVYEVQLSRELNPANNEDAAYLKGLTPAQALLKPGEEWFAVFMQVRNPTNLPRPATPNITIEDTQNNRYLPIIPGPTNEFAYRAELVPANSLIPVPGTPASRGGTNGQLLLYKIKTTSLNNRPIEVRIIDPVTGKEAKAILDV
jgi:hypothetical protein